MTVEKCLSRTTLWLNSISNFYPCCPFELQEVGVEVSLYGVGRPFFNLYQWNISFDSI